MPPAATTASWPLLNLEQVFFAFAGGSIALIKDILLLFFVLVSYPCFYHHFKTDFSSLTFIVMESFSEATVKA